MASTIPDPQGDVIERAVSSIRGMPVPQGPSALTAQRTIAALWAAELEAERARSRWVMRIAAVIVVGVCAAATAVVMVERRQLASQVNPPPPTSPAQRDATHTQPRVVADRSQSGGPQIVPAFPTSVDSTASSVAMASEIMVTGHVYFEGTPPVRRPIDFSACPQCLSELRGPVYDDSTVVNVDGTLANVVIWISGGLPAGKKYEPRPPAVLDQNYCMFEPHVLAMMAGEPMIVRNGGKILHNAHATDSMNAPLFNFTLAPGEERTVEPMQRPQTIKVDCDLHPWMHAWIKVLDNPFFDVTRRDGTYSIRDLPPGEYRISAWHESLGVQEKQVVVGGGEPVVLDFTFEAK